MKKMKLNIQLFAGSVSIGTITETTDINTNQSTFSIPATMTTSGQTFNNDDAYMTLQWRYSGGSWTTISKKTFGISTNSSKTKSWSLTLTHEDDGTLPDIQFRVRWYITSSTNGTTGAKTYSPTTIPRASEIDSATGGTTPFPPTIVFTPKSVDFKYILKYMYGSEALASSGFISPNQTTPYTYNSLTLPNNVFRGVDSETMTITAVLQTFQRDLTQIGEATKTFDITLNSSVKPIISITRVIEADSTMRDLNWKDANDNFIYIQNHSKLLITTSTSYISPAASNVSTNISTNSQTFNENGYSTFNFTTNALTSSGSKTITATATDSRGRSATTSTTYNVVAYSNPTIITAQVERCDANGNVSKDGEYCKISYGASISSCLGKNTPYAIYKVGYRVQDTGDYEYIPLGSNADSKTLSGVLFTDGIKSASSSGTKVRFSTDYTYDIQFYVEDAFTETTNVQPLDTGFDLMNFNASGKAMAIGKVSEAGANEELLEIALPTRFSEDIYFKELDMFNDTSGSDWQAMMKNKIDYCINNINTSKESTSAFINGGWSGVNYGFGIFSKIGTVYQLKWFSSNSTYYVRKTGSSYSYYNENDVDFFRANSIEATNGIYSKATGNVGTPTGGSNLIIKRANNSEAPNNGVVLEFGNSTSWVGQLYIGDNATQGVYYNGWSNGVRGSWRKLAWEPVSLYDNSSGSNASITLSETSSNFAYLEIFYRTNDDYRSSKKIYSPNGKKVILDASIISGNYTYVKSAQYSISGTSISLESNLSGQARIGNNVATTWNKDSNRLYIEKVIGYRW